MEALVSVFPALVDVVLKGGVVGVLVLVILALVLDRHRLVKEGAKTYRQRDYARLCFTIVKTAADSAGVKYDLSPADAILKDDAAPV